MLFFDIAIKQFGNPIEWGSAKRAFALLVVYLLGQCIYLFSLWFALGSDTLTQFLNIELAQAHLQHFRQFTITSLFLICAVAVLARQWPSCHAYEHLAVQYFAISHVYYGYTIGLMGLPTGVVLAGVTVLGFISMNRSAVVYGFATAMIALLSITYLTLSGQIPYAPLAATSVQYDSQLQTVWTAVYGVFSIPILAILFSISYIVLRRWRMREEQVQVLSSTDPLTGLLNRRCILEHLAKAKKKSELTGEPLAVVLLDLDHFKQINDTWGHDVGDNALRVAAETLKKTVRQNDFVGRYGGEEFLIVLPGLEPEQARMLAERIRLAIAGTKVDINLEATLNVTASLGMCCCQTKHQLSQDELIKQADAALYQAKNDGRDKLVVAG